eukprot:362553-Chlamydomonas_euryale.AAC.3
MILRRSLDGPASPVLCRAVRPRRSRGGRGRTSRDGAGVAVRPSPCSCGEFECRIDRASHPKASPHPPKFSPQRQELRDESGVHEGINQRHVHGAGNAAVVPLTLLAVGGLPERRDKWSNYEEKILSSGASVDWALVHRDSMIGHGSPIWVGPAWWYGGCACAGCLCSPSKKRRTRRYRRGSFPESGPPCSAATPRPRPKSRREDPAQRLIVSARRRGAARAASGAVDSEPSHPDPNIIAATSSPATPIEAPCAPPAIASPARAAALPTYAGDAAPAYDAGYRRRKQAPAAARLRRVTVPTPVRSQLDAT